MGCFFGLYFIVDSWKASDYAPVFFLSILLPFLLELSSILLIKIYKKQAIE